MLLLHTMLATPSVDFLIDRVTPGYSAPEVPTGALHPIWGLLLSAALAAAVIAVSLMGSKRAMTE